jgi:hypothetical protein
MKPFATISAGAFAAVLALSACGGSSGGGDDVASLDSSGGKKSSTTTQPKRSFEDAALEFARCMRKHGVQMPDPEFSDNGKGGVGVINQGGNGGPNEPDQAAFEAADKACRPIMDAAMKDAPRPSAEERAEMRDHALKMARCMRSKGYDFPDPEFDESGGATIKASGGSGPGGIVPDSAKFREDQEACAEEAGDPPGGGSNTVRSDG